MWVPSSPNANHATRKPPATNAHCTKIMIHVGLCETISVQDPPKLKSSNGKGRILGKMWLYGSSTKLLSKWRSGEKIVSVRVSGDDGSGKKALLTVEHSAHKSKRQVRVL